MAEIKRCDFRACKYNSACCTSGVITTECTCTNKEVSIKYDNINKTFICDSLQVESKKERTCETCSVIKNGSIEISIMKRKLREAFSKMSEI